MKKLLLALLIAVTVMLGITACATDDSTGDNAQNSTDTGSIEDTFREGSTVWYYASDVHIIPATGITRDDLEPVRDKIDTLAKNVYISSVYAEEQKCELIIGYVEDREASVKAYRLLERMEKESYFDARYVIYAEDGKVAIAFDENEYSSLQPLSYALDYFTESFIDGKEYVAFGAGNRFENTVDLIEEQELIDGALMAEAWDNLFIEAGGETNPERAQAIVDVIKKMHAMYDENVIGWYANLYDPVNGGFYISNSGRNNDGFLPDIESTVQALSWLQGTGMLGFADDNYANALPEWMKNQIIAFAKSLQSPKNGYFYHPQWTQEMVDNKISRRGRDLGWATSVLKQLGSAPTYNAPDGTRGDGIDEYEFWVSVDWYGYIGDKSEFEIGDSASVTVSLGGSTADAVAAVIATSDVILTADDNTSYLANHENFYNYMWSLPLYQTAGISYTIGNDFNATRKQILAKSKTLGEYLDDPSKPYYGMTLCDIWIDYFNQKANPENGLWEEKTSFAGTNGLMKLYSSYTLFGECLPYPMQSAQSVIYNLTSDEDPSHVCHNYNLWVSIVGIKDNVRKYGDPETRDAVLAYIDEALKDSAVEMIEMTIKRVSKFQKPDGSFSYHENVNGGTSQGLPVSLSINEGGINATSICMVGNFNEMLAAFGFSKIDIFGEADWMRFCEIIDGLGPITKFTPEPVIVDFEDGEYSSFQAMRGATLDVVDYNGSRQLMMSFSHLTSGWPGMDITKTLASNSGDYMVIEGDFTFMNAQDGYYEFYINASSAKPMYFQFHITGNTVKIVQSRVSSGPSFTIGARGQQIHLRLEYFLNSKGESALRINVGGKYIGTITNDNKNTSALGGALPLNINRIEFAGSYKNGGCVYVDNFNFGPDFYQDLDGDEIPDAFPDNEAAEGGGAVIPTPGATSPIDFESIANIDPTIIKISHDNHQIVEYNGSKALEVTFGADTSDEIIIYKTKSAEPEANTLVFKADITPTITGQYNINLRNSSSTRLAQFTINNQGGETGICGAYDNDGVWQSKFCEVQKTISLRVEYGPVEQDGKTYMQLRAYVNGELKFESKLIDKYLATEENSIRNINHIRIAENNKAQGTGKLYLDNVEFAEVLKLPETLPEDAVDEQGFVKFEEMESIDALIAKAKLADTLVVTEKNGKGAMAFKYTKGVSEEFTLYPTKNETAANLMVLEANVTDSYANPRVLKIWAGSRLVYDFRINGSGGFGAESNKSWWGSGKYQKDVTFNLAITVKVTDGKVDLNLYINGEKVARPTGSTGYGVNLDLTCEADLVEKISHITITDNEQSTGPDAGTVYLTDYRFVKVVDDGSFVPSAPGEGGEGGTPDTPVTPPYENDLSSHYVSFDGMTAVNTSIMKPGSTGTAITVGKLDGSDAAKLEFGLERWDEAFMYPTYKNSSANSVIVEMDIMFDAEHADGAYATFYLRGASSEKLYVLNVRSTADGFTIDDNMGLSKKNAVAREKFTIRIEFNEVTVSGEKKYQILLFVNGELLNASDPIGKTSKNNIPDIGRFDILSSTTFDGAAYIDNFAFIRAFRDVKFEGEVSHEHNFVDGKCECGESDPDYKPECEHSYTEGVCTKCGEADPDYKPECEHSFSEGVCTKCGESDPDYKPEGGDDPVVPPVGEKSIKILFFGNSYSVDATKWLSRIFLEAGYKSVIVGNVATGGCCINEHWSFLDGIAGNEPNGGDFFYTKYVNGKEVATEDDYAFAIADEDWDIISIQHAPDELKQIDTYSHLQDFLDYILARVTNEDVKLVFHMIWAHNNVADIKGLYNSILEITDRYVTVKTEFDGLVPSATMIEYLRDAGLTNATLNDDGSWTAGDISRDWGHLNYGLGRYAVALLYYAYLTGESIDDFAWVPTADMVAGTSEANGFAEITAEKLALIKEAIKYALANPYGEDYEPKNGDGIGFPDCEMGGGETDGTPLTPDKDGYISFEDMTAEGSVLVISNVIGGLRVTENGGSDALEFIYSTTSTEQFKLLPTLSEAGADMMILEADVTDSFSQPRVLKIMAGTRVVYDFRINGSGGFAAEGNQVWWGGGHYQADTKYNLKITVEAKDGKVDVCLYVNGSLVNKPSAYGTKIDITAEENLVELITHVDIIDGSTSMGGSVYIDNYRFVKLATETPGEGGGDPVTPPEGGDTHEHNFVNGKCECGAEDPDYKPESSTPLTPDKDGYISFEDMTAEGSVLAICNVIGGLRVTENGGSDALEFIYSGTATEQFKLLPTLSESRADMMIFEADVTDCFSKPRTLKIMAGDRLVYDFRINGSGGFGAESNKSWWGGGHYQADTKFNLKITVQVTDGKIDLNLYINGNMVTRPTSGATAYGANLDLSCTDDLVELITHIDIIDGSSSAVGSVYIDNYRFVKLATETPGEGGDPVTPPEGGDTHEHSFVDGKCECGESDPDYKPECEHSYAEGVCTKCGEADPDYTPEGGEPDAPAEPETPASDYGTPLTFEGIEAANPSVIKSYKDTASALAEHNGSTAFAANFSDATNDEFYVYRTEPDDENANTYVFEATITPTISGQYTFKLRGPSSSTLYSFTVNGSGGAYDNEGVWQANFAPAGTTLKIRIEYSAVESGGVTYMQTRVYIDGELKVTSKLVEKYVATGANEIGDVLYVQIAENTKTNAGTFYIDNIVSRGVNVSAE